MASLIAFHISSDRPHELVKMQKDRRVFDAICPNKMGQQCIRLRAANKKGKVMMPRSSSPITEYVDKMPCIVEQAFATIAWDDLDDCASVMRRESDSLDSQVNDSDGDDQDFGEYALDFIADSPATLESSLSPTGLVPFQGCIIPPLTPHPDISSEHSLNNPPAADKPHVQDATLWKDIAQHQGRMLEGTMETNNQLREAVCRRKQEINSLQERNVHLRELASRAKDLASVLDKLMRTVKEPYVTEPVLLSSDTTCNSTSPCKRQRLDEECESVTSGCSVEDILRDISTRCNAVLQGPRPQQECDSIRMYGAFSGLQTSISKGNSVSAVGAEAGEHASFRTSIREHCTIRTQVFPQGHAFTSRTQHGGYRFRWVPNHS